MLRAADGLRDGALLVQVHHASGKAVDPGLEPEFVALPLVDRVPLLGHDASREAERAGGGEAELGEGGQATALPAGGTLIIHVPAGVEDFDCGARAGCVVYGAGALVS
ncbi:hypothetical protein [Methylobacterium sp. NEAU K]|uniref:hypothetical protein n=1 Tax=Methylobacterium sp. NEAU K TaxID=3064946 RepID=UPI00273410D8|nr:hypothetical protein [Methylobacterium sp. NEAU K]MDP4002143.1 hypothetical protein [Methylobacterium sp. NEAU K]